MEEIHEDDKNVLPDPAEDVQAPLAQDHNPDLPVHDFIVDLPPLADPILDASDDYPAPSGADLPLEEMENIDPEAAADAIWQDVDSSPSEEPAAPDEPMAPEGSAPVETAVPEASVSSEPAAQDASAPDAPSEVQNANPGEHADAPVTPPESRAEADTATAPEPATNAASPSEQPTDAPASSEHPDPYADPSAAPVTYEAAMAAINAMPVDATVAHEPGAHATDTDQPATDAPAPHEQPADAPVTSEHPDPYADPNAVPITYEAAMAAIDAMANDALNQEAVPASFPGFEQFNGIHGTPIEDMNLWEQQSQPFSCAVATTDMLFRSCGFDVGEPALATLFQSEGIYDPNMGTDVHQIADVVNHAAAESGIHVEAIEIRHFSEQNLEAMLDHGVRPLIGVNSSELYDPAQRFLNAIGVIPNAGHAVQLTGIIKNEQGSFAVINDPGFPDGGGRVIPLDLFMDAASKMDFDAVALIPT